MCIKYIVSLFFLLIPPLFLSFFLSPSSSPSDYVFLFDCPHLSFPLFFLFFFSLRFLLSFPPSIFSHIKSLFSSFLLSLFLSLSFCYLLLISFPLSSPVHSLLFFFFFFVPRPFLHLRRSISESNVV